MNYFHKTCGYMFKFLKFSLSLKYFIKKKDTGSVYLAGE